MIKEQLKLNYLKMLSDLVNDFSYHDIDGFCEDNELTQDQIDELLSLNIQVIEV